MRVLGTVDVRDGRVDEVERIDAEIKGLDSRKRERGYIQTMLAGPSKRSVKYEGKTDYKV